MSNVYPQFIGQLMSRHGQLYISLFSNLRLGSCMHIMYSVKVWKVSGEACSWRQRDMPFWWHELFLCLSTAYLSGNQNWEERLLPSKPLSGDFSPICIMPQSPSYCVQFFKVDSSFLESNCEFQRTFSPVPFDYTILFLFSKLLLLSFLGCS